MLASEEATSSNVLLTGPFGGLNDDGPAGREDGPSAGRCPGGVAPYV
jgi:hypothetical protein